MVDLQSHVYVLELCYDYEGSEVLGVYAEYMEALVALHRTAEEHGYQMQSISSGQDGYTAKYYRGVRLTITKYEVLNGNVELPV